ncbi:hypothetical protein ACHAWF_018933, partial [Thalassiosira exigua]
VCATFHEGLGRHALWSLVPARRPEPTPPLWRTTGRGEGRRRREEEEGGAGGRGEGEGDDGAASSEGSRRAFDAGRAVPSSFAIVHPDFALVRFHVEDPPFLGKGAGSQAAPTVPRPRPRRRRRRRRRAFLAADVRGRGDLTLCALGPNPRRRVVDDDDDDEEGGGARAASEPAILRCFALRLGDGDDDDGGTNAIVASASRRADLPCAAAAPVRALPAPLAPFRFEEEGAEAGGGGGGRRTSRFRTEDADATAVDILVLRRGRNDAEDDAEDDADADADVDDDDDDDDQRRQGYALSLYRAGTVHVADFALPAPSTFATSAIPRPVDLEHAAGDRVDVRFVDVGGPTSASPPSDEVVLRASFSLAPIPSPVAETAVRAIESSLLDPLFVGTRAEDEADDDVAALSPSLRADVLQRFRQAETPGAEEEEDDDDGAWRALSDILLPFLLGTGGDDGRVGGKRWRGEEEPSPTSRKSASSGAWEDLLRSDFHREFSRGEGAALFGAFDLDDASSSAYASDDGASRDDRADYEVPSSSRPPRRGAWARPSVRRRAFDALHLLHEDARLARRSRGTAFRQRLGVLLLRVAEGTSPLMEDYEDHYRRVLGDGLSQTRRRSPSPEGAVGKERLSNFAVCPCVMTCLDAMLRGGGDGNELARGAWTAFESLTTTGLNGACPTTWLVLRLYRTLLAPATIDNGNSAQRGRDRSTVLAMLDEGVRRPARLLDELPVGVALPLLEAARRCRLDPPRLDAIEEGDRRGDRWPAAAFDLVGRNDLAEYLSRSSGAGGSAAGVPDDASDSPSRPHPSDEDPGDDPDGLSSLEDQSSTIFPDDNRVREASRLLRSSRPLYLRVPRPPELSDHDYERAKQERLLLLCRRSIALPLGRGMLTLGTTARGGHARRSSMSSGAERTPVPDIVLAGRVPPANGTVALDMSSCPANFRIWPEFHNGVAAGLRLPRVDNGRGGGEGGGGCSRTWIKFNRPAGAASVDVAGGQGGQAATTPNYAHGGFLMALGLRGHLSALNTTDLTDYLTQGTITTTVGIFLGMAANKRGSCDPSVSKMLCLHVPSLLPPSFIPMDLASTVQAAAVAGIGLLYQGSSHRLMTEFLLNEIGRQPVKDQSSNDREGFALVCGLALGMVNLGKGASTVSGLEDLRIEERLHRYITGRTDAGAEIHGRKEGPDGTGGGVGDNDRNSRIYEVNSLNRDITAPGATLALGLMYIKSHNISVASGLRLPQTHFSLDYVRPDLLALRVISRSLILWNDVEPTSEWIDAQIPSIVKNSVRWMKDAAKKAMAVGSMSEETDVHNMMVEEQSDAEIEAGERAKQEDIADFDPEAVRQANAHIVAGACFSLGLKYAGSANRVAASTIVERALWFLELRDNRDVATLVQRPDDSTLITCLCATALSLAMVMAGTGDLDAFRLFRALRWKCDESTIYGAHLAFGAATGLLFLGGGRCTLGSEPEDVAMLIAAFFPHFPILSSDNQYHLQALRHLYVLAVHERILEAVDVDSNEKVCIPIELSLADSDEPLRTSTPFLVTNDSKFVELCLNSDRYYPIVINASEWKTGGTLSTLFVKRRAGHLGYLEDPNGLRSISMQTGTSGHQSFLKSVKLFSKDDALLISFTKYFCFSSFEDDNLFERFCSDIAYECMKEEKSEILPIYLKMFRLIELKDGKKVSIDDVWDAKLLRTYAETRKLLGDRSVKMFDLVNRQSIHLLCQTIDDGFNVHVSEQMVSSFICQPNRKWWEIDSSLGPFLVWNEVPLKYCGVSS